MTKFRPPLTSLPAFEAVARLKSFTQAADELNVSQSAISHQIRALEQFLGERLFYRRGRLTELTDEGSRYYDGISNGLLAIEQATRTLMGGTRQQLRFALFSSFAVRWLIPNLTDLQHQHPDLDLRLEMTNESPVLSDRVADCFMTLHNTQEGYLFDCLYPENLFAVCSHRYWEQLLNRSSHASSSTALVSLLLSEGTLLSNASVFSDEYGDWQRWCRANGVELPSSPRIHGFSHMLMALEAARHHQGIALTNDYMMDEKRDSDLIKLPFNGYATGDTFYFAYKQSRRHDPDIQRFRHWLRTQAERSGLTPGTKKPG